MTKILIWIVVVFAVLFGLRLLNVAKARRRANESAGRKPQEPQVETMVRCARCGVFLPRPDAAVAADGYRCREPACAGSHPPPR